MRRGFRRGMASVLLAGSLVLAVAGCANPPGTDGDLTNQWPAMAATTGWEPKAGVCHDEFAATLYRPSYRPMDCSQSHRYETVHLGQFTGEAAALSTPPKNDGAEMKAAWAECEAKTTEFLGADWRNGRIWVGVSVPGSGNWASGARWFRCEVAATEDPRRTPRFWSGSLKGAFGGESELKFGCGQATKVNDDIQTTGVACTAGHNTEFVGAVAVNDSREELKKGLASVHTKCLSLIATYVGLPNDGKMQYRTGTLYEIPAEADWEMGDRKVKCHIYLSKNVTRSLKGTGNSGLPINYA